MAAYDSSKNHDRTAVTLIEILVVIGIMALLAGMIVYLPNSDRRHAAVRGAAEELAATLKFARSLAIDQRSVCGVAFNISNAAGTSGIILNNQDGGHWYRIIGPSVNDDSITALSGYPQPNFVPWKSGNVGSFLRDVDASWLGDRHILPPKRVRFLALGDQDNGSGGWKGASRFPTTYPRPWFGWYDPTNNRLYPWGGYDHALLDPAGRSCSGFYFEGQDGAIVGSVNPADRATTNTASSSQYGFFSAGKTRPVVNAQWLDYVIKFYPDGTVSESSPMGNRRTSWYRKSNTASNVNDGGGFGNGDFGDFTAFPGTTWNDASPITSYVRHTGVYSITLAPDSDRDSDVFANVNMALDSIMPAYRVQVSNLGEVSVIAVTRKPKSGATLDTTSITNWQTTSQISSKYKNWIATNNDGTLRGMPVSNFLTPEILAARQWWMNVP